MRVMRAKYLPYANTYNSLNLDPANLPNATIFEAISLSSEAISLDARCQHIKKLIKINPDCVKTENALGVRPLHWAAYDGSDPRILKLFPPEEYAMKDAFDLTPMHLAAREDKVEVVMFLYERDSGLAELRAKDGSTPILTAAYNGSMDVLLFLCDSNPNLMHATNGSGNNVMHAAANMSRINIVKLLCGRIPALATLRADNGETPMHIAAHEGHVDVVACLYDFESHLAKEEEPGDGRTPMHTACAAGRLKVVIFLYDSDPGLALEKDDQGSSALHVAARRGHLDVARFLSSKDPLLWAQKDNEGQTPLNVSEAMGHHQIGATWRQAGSIDQLSETSSDQQGSVCTATDQQEPVEVAEYERKESALLQEYETTLQNDLEQWVDKMEIISTSVSLVRMESVESLNRQVKIDRLATRVAQHEVVAGAVSYTDLPPPVAEIPPTASMTSRSQVTDVTSTSRDTVTTTTTTSDSGGSSNKGPSSQSTSASAVLSSNMSVGSARSA